jgi:hypothetical protein
MINMRIIQIFQSLVSNCGKIIWHITCLNDHITFNLLKPSGNFTYHQV